MKAGVSTACLYPELLEKALLRLAESGVRNTEIFFNTHCETEKSFIDELKSTLDYYDMKCASVHPYTCPMEPMIFFSSYERRVQDALEYYRRFFNAMNMLGADVFVFHGNKRLVPVSEELYFERFYRLVRLGKEYGINVAQENVSRCQSANISFLSNLSKALGDDASFVLDIKQSVRADENPMEMLDALGKKIIHVHISDHGKKGDCLPVGAGEFEVETFLKKLEGLGFDGSVIIELYRCNFSDAALLADNYRLLESKIKKLCNKK